MAETSPNDELAFPEVTRTEEWVNEDAVKITDFETLGGMSLRDYFAARAMQGMVTRGGDLVYSREGDQYGALAARAYLIADAMLRARALGR